jgi:type IV pilus assembly protein PilV
VPLSQALKIHAIGQTFNMMSLCFYPTYPPSYRQRDIVGGVRHIGGFTLIEVMVSMVIMSVGLLGIFAMQSRALMDNQDAYLRTQAIALAYDMGDRIRANHDYWERTLLDPVAPNYVGMATLVGNAANSYHVCNAYDPGNDPNDPEAMPEACSDQDMAEYDVHYSQSTVASVLPGGALTIALAADTNAPLAGQVIQVTVSWTRVNAATAANLGAVTRFSLDVRL